MLKKLNANLTKLINQLNTVYTIYSYAKVGSISSNLLFSQQCNAFQSDNIIGYILQLYNR